MLLEVLLFLLLGTALGVLMGLVPGIHPNMILLLIPSLLLLNISPLMLIVFVVSLGITNVFLDYIPSILLGAPDSSSALSVLPGHRLLLEGRGYQAIKLTLTGGLLSIFFCLAFLPLAILGIPQLYEFVRPFLHFVLIGIVAIMIATERKIKKIFWCTTCFLLAGIIGILSFKMPIDNTLILFPVLAGFFGMPFLILQIKAKNTVPDQKLKDEKIPRKIMLKSSLLGTVGGVFSGFLPGVGSSEIAGFATIDKNEKSFLITLGAIAMANLVMSFMMLWLVGSTRSGLAVAIDQILSIGQNEFLIIVAAILASAGIAAMLTLVISKRMIKIIQKADYSLISKIVVMMIVCLVFYFTGFLGLMITGICCALGLFVNIMDIKRGIMMGVLIVPTILFFAGINV